MAVLSDLHVGPGARAKDLCPAGIDSHAIEDAYKDTFLTFLRKNSIVASYLVLPGDISHFGDPSEVKLASQVISEVAKMLKVKRDHLIFVPGNHGSALTNCVPNTPIDANGKLTLSKIGIAKTKASYDPRGNLVR